MPFLLSRFLLHPKRFVMRSRGPAYVEANVRSLCACRVRGGGPIGRPGTWGTGHFDPLRYILNLI